MGTVVHGYNELRKNQLQHFAKMIGRPVNVAETLVHEMTEPELVDLKTAIRINMSLNGDTESARSVLILYEKVRFRGSLDAKKWLGDYVRE